MRTREEIVAKMGEIYVDDLVGYDECKYWIDALYWVLDLGKKKRSNNEEDTKTNER